MPDLTFVTSWSLLTPWWLIGFGVVGLLFLLWAIRQKRRKRRGFVVLLILAIIFFVIAGVFGTNMVLKRYPTVYALVHNQPVQVDFGETPSDPSQGVTQTAEIAGTESGVGSFPANIWMPPQYYSDKNAKFPVIYLYHGLPGAYSNWIVAFGAGPTLLNAAKAGQPVIAVMPTVNPQPDVDSECVDGTAGNWQTYLNTDVTGWVSKNLGDRILSGPQHAAVGGLSMGGYCAQAMALRNPSQFSAFGNISGTTAPQFDGGLPALFGPVPNLQQTINSYTSTWIIANQPASNKVRSWLAVGSGDEASLKADQAQYAAQARARGMTVVSHPLTGDHNGSVWQEGLEAWFPVVYPLIK